MKVHRSSLNYQLWKQWHGERSEPKGVCRYFWFSVFQWTLGWLALAIMIAIIAMVVVIVIASIATGWLCGYRMNFGEGPSFSLGYKIDLYNRKLRKRKYPLAPWEAIGIPAVLFAAFHTVKFLMNHYVAIMQGVGAAVISIKPLVFYLFLVAIVVVLASGINALWDDELVREFRRACKEKLCPSIEVVE